MFTEEGVSHVRERERESDRAEGGESQHCGGMIHWTTDRLSGPIRELAAGHDNNVFLSHYTAYHGRHLGQDFVTKTLT